MMKPPRLKSGIKPVYIVWGLVALVSVGALAVTWLLFVEPPPPRRATIAAGSRDGAYHAYAERYAALLAAEGFTLEVRQTQGSVENLNLLADPASGVSIGIVQSGLATPELSRQLVSIGSLYREPLWVFYRGAEPVTTLSGLAGRRVAIGPLNSGTHRISLEMLEVNGLKPSGPETESAAAPPTQLLDAGGLVAAEALERGEIDAAFFVASPEAPYIRKLLTTEGIRLLNFTQAEAYRKRFRYLSTVTLSAGGVDLGRNLPAEDITLIAPAATLVVRDDLHPAVVTLLLDAAAQVHSAGDLLSEPKEFPSDHYVDFPLSEDASRFYKSGPPFLQRYLPFWFASLADRLKVLLVPIIMLMMPLFRFAPPLVRWRTRRKIYLWYTLVRDIDRKVMSGIDVAQLRQEMLKVREIEEQVAEVDVPLSYMDEFYDLRVHLSMIHNKIERKLAEAGVEPATLPSIPDPS